MYKLIFICLLFTAGVLMEIFAQNGEQIAMDSLSRIVNSPKIEQREKIKPMVELSLVFADEGDSLKAKELLNQARTLARKQKDSKYMVYVLNSELKNILDIYPRNITKIYKIIDSVYVAISKTADLEAQASGYDCIGYMKSITDLKYNFDDCFTAISLTEKLPESSPEKYVLLFNVYKTLFAENMRKGKTANTEKYLNEMYRTAEKTGNENNICLAINAKMYFTIHSPKDEKQITQNFESLERYISQNKTRLSSLNYLNSVTMLWVLYLTYPNIHYKELLKPHIEHCKKISGNNPKTKRMLLVLNFYDAYERKDYAKAIELCKEQVQIDKIANPNLVSNRYQDLFIVYTEAGQYQQASEAMAESMKYYKQSMNEQVEEQRQLAEVKFETEKKENALKLAQIRIVFLLVVAVLVICFLIVYFTKRHARIKLQKENAEQQRANAELQKENAEQQAKLMKYEKELTQKKLVASNMQIMKKNKTLEQITEKTNDREIKKLIKTDRASDKTYADYNRVFGEIHPEFFEFLQKRAAPKRLTTLELRYCAYIYMRKSNQELSEELNVSYNTVLSHKGTLKKRLKVDRKMSLDDFIQSFHPSQT
ncbi:MAG: LuxR C-terminal-related transcriptional regulator [Tannerella sp.]|jgi:DNA-binding CsgD family transcriptional regulator|nr:LuxR C-terminal-related transcriptional regulator [Tannerella sp.]